MPNVIFIGAGPVGLFTAIQLKLENPKASILMLEKYPEYKRNHTLLLNQSSFKKVYPDPEFKKFVSGLHHTIRTSVLESKLLECAKRLGIEIEYKEILGQREEKSKPYPNSMTIEELCKHYPDTTIMIGADGSHSIVHQQVFNHEYQKNNTVEYIAEIKYEVEGASRALNPMTELPLPIYYAHHVVTEHVGKEENGKTPIAVRIFINEKTYESMKTATFKTPYHLDDEKKMDKALYETMTVWLKARKDMVKEKLIKGSERITTTHLPIYASKEFVKKNHGKTWFLVGDAAFGVPYFRSLNNGILCSPQLAHSVALLLENPTLAEPEESYTKYCHHLIKREIRTANTKTAGVKSLKVTSGVTQNIYQFMQGIGEKIPIVRDILPEISMTSGAKQFKKELHEEKQRKHAGISGGKALTHWLHSGPLAKRQETEPERKEVSLKLS